MLFVLAARREAPAALIAVTRRGVPVPRSWPPRSIGFLCVIAAAVSPDTVFPFLLNSSGAIILFVYLLIAVSQIVLRRRTPDSELQGEDVALPGAVDPDRAWRFVAILVQMGLDAGHPVAAGAEPAVLGRGAGAVLRQQVVHQSAPGTQRGSPRRRSRAGCSCWPTRPWTPSELLDELRRIGADRAASTLSCVPASPIETGVAATHGPLDVWEATLQAAQERLDHTLSTLRSENLDADGALGDQRPLRALANAVDSFHPDQIVIATLPPEYSVWHRSTSSTAPVPSIGCR